MVVVGVVSVVVERGRFLVQILEQLPMVVPLGLGTQFEVST